MIILDAVQSILTIFAMMAVGYYLTGRGWFDEDVSELFSKMVIKVSLPAFMFSNMISTFDRGRLTELAAGLVIPIASMILLYIISSYVAKLLRIPAERRGVFLSMFALSNTIFIGLPVNVALFGDESIPFVLLYYFVNTMVFWTIGVYEIRRETGSGGTSFFRADNLKRILSPPLAAFVISISVVFFNVGVPRFLLDAAGYIGNLTTPLSMLYMGIIIHSIDVHSIKPDREMLALLTGRFILAPLLVLFLVNFSAMPVLMKKVFVIEAAMPVMTQIAIVAQAYGADHKYATVTATVSTLASLVFVPIYMVLVSLI